MEEDLRRELEALCQFILSNNRPGARREQLSRVQLLYEKLTVLQYLEAQAAENRSSAPPPVTAPDRAESPEALAPEPTLKEMSAPPEPTEAPAEERKDRPQEQPQPATSLEAAPDQNRESAPVKVEKGPLETKASQPTKAEVAPAEPAKVAPSSRAQPTPKGGGSLNKRLGKGSIEVGLNDRIGLVKHLFDGQQEDFNRVLSQLNTLDGLTESLRFIEEMVKPDYDWSAAEEYEERLIALVHQRFGEELSED